MMSKLFLDSLRGLYEFSPNNKTGKLITELANAVDQLQNEVVVLRDIVEQYKKIRVADVLNRGDAHDPIKVLNFIITEYEKDFK